MLGSQEKVAGVTFCEFVEKVLAFVRDNTAGAALCEHATLNIQS